ncbi:MAG: hypothetical protein AAF357_02960 [Verrucomicrobiota bacterium]
MKSEDLEAITETVSAEDIRIAVVGALNTYLREVLEPFGIIDRKADEAFPDHACSERNTAKYQIAARAALVALKKVPDFNWKQEEPWT